jgi:hypothetical protein
MLAGQSSSSTSNRDGPYTATIIQYGGVMDTNPESDGFHFLLLEQNIFHARILQMLTSCASDLVSTT